MLSVCKAKDRDREPPYTVSAEDVTTLINILKEAATEEHNIRRQENKENP